MDDKSGESMEPMEEVPLTPVRFRSVGARLGNDSWQVVHTGVLPSSNNRSWHRCKSRAGNGRLWKRCGLPSITPDVSPLPAQDQRNGDEHRTLASHGLLTGGLLSFLMIMAFFRVTMIFDFGYFRLRWGEG